MQEFVDALLLKVNQLDIEESIQMLKEAKKAGFDTIIATPHVRKSNFDKSIVKENMDRLRPFAESIGIKLLQGFEYNISALADDGIEGALDFCTEKTKTLLLEMNGSRIVSNWERIVIHFQREGAEVIIAHPERYPSLYSNKDMVSRMLEIGCKFQVDIDVMLEGGLFNKGRKFAKSLLENGRARWVASDAHTAEDYVRFAQAFNKYGSKELCMPDMFSYAELIK